MVLIDGKGGNKCPGHLTSLTDEKEATTLCGDAKFAYDWNWSRSGATHGDVETTTVNQIRYEPQPERWMDTPITYLHSFFSPFRLAREKGNPVDFAFRTALLRRGKHPYVVIADTIQKDTNPHRYEFLMRIPDDLADQVKIEGNDIVLSDPKSSNRMLVRFVTPGKVEVSQRKVLLRKDTNKLKSILSVAVDAVKPDYRVVFYPFKEGAPLPKTSWSEASGELSLQFGTQVDTCRFEKNSKGQPAIRLSGL